jgi:hypothetical protein
MMNKFFTDRDFRTSFKAIVTLVAVEDHRSPGQFHFDSIKTIMLRLHQIQHLNECTKQGV